jgi:hypothetical protein
MAGSPRASGNRYAKVPVVLIAGRVEDRIKQSTAGLKLSSSSCPARARGALFRA